MAERDDSVLVKALPPATDYMTYLTIVEYNLTAESLPVLHDVLQNATLTMNIGWDLVELLLPLLPASGPCLQTIARLGNPREVVLKVTEAIMSLDFDGTVHARLEQNTAQDKINSTSITSELQTPTNLAASDLPGIDQVMSIAFKFKTLLSMLSILHPRIKTKNPSRFLSSSLQAVLTAFSRSGALVALLVRSVHDFLSEMINTKPDSTAPLVPPRTTENLARTSTRLPLASGVEGVSEQPPTEELSIQRKLLQTFVTHAVEVYLMNLSSVEDVPGFGWSMQAFERLNAEQMVPGKITFDVLLATNPSVRNCHSAMEQFLDIARQTGLNSPLLLAGALLTPAETTDSVNERQEEDPPSAADEIPLSNGGSLFLLAVSNVKAIMHGNARSSRVIAIFPYLAKLVRSLVETDHSLGLPREGDSTIDALMSLCLIALDANEVGEPSHEQYEDFLQIMSSISASNPSSMLRYYAHYITSSVLRCNPSAEARLNFIRNTLEHSGFENLKVSAVSWIKGETLEASSPSLQSDGESKSIFARPDALRSLREFLFPDLREPLNSSDIEQDWDFYKTNLSFILSSLNFYYLLVSALHLRTTLDIAKLHREEQLDAIFLTPLRRSTQFFRGELDGGVVAKQVGEEGLQGAHMDLMLVDDALRRVESVLPGLQKF